MNERIRNRTGARWALWFYPAWLVLTVIVTVTAAVLDSGWGWVYLCFCALLLFALRPGSGLYARAVENGGRWKALGAIPAAGAVIAACVLPMGRLPIWNGEIPGHRNQYELMAEAILDGRVEFAYGDEDELFKLDNPYDPEEREASGVRYHWDHAWYNGHYYMYFGVVPVFLVFIPYRLLTGDALTTYHATQLFAALSVAGIFALFYLLARLFFKKLPYVVYLALSGAVSAMSLWYATAEPALYCTAITSALALEIWSLWFFVRAVWDVKREDRQLLLAGAGALLGALSFGCRPSVALANLLVIPMLAVFLRQRRITGKLLGRLALAALPYALVAAGLMWYNYIRFEDPFEFGQAYQLTVADQSRYGVSLDPKTLLRVIREMAVSFFGSAKPRESFPWLRAGGVFLNFPILLLCGGAFSPTVRKSMRRYKLPPLMAGIVITVLVISAVDIMWTPYLLERYHMDIYFLMGIACYLVIGLWSGGEGRGRRLACSAASVLSVVTVISAFLLYAATIRVKYPEIVGGIASALRLA